MRRLLSSSVLGAMAVAALLCPAAQAAPGPVSVRVEGSTVTLLAPTLVATRSGPYTPLGKTNACPGTSAAEALDLATLTAGTTWAGTFNAGFGDYFVTAIGGELHPTGAADGSYWSFWYDNAPAQLGVCGQQLNSGDQILFFPDCFGKCPAGFVSPNVLSMTAPPTVVQKGAAATVTVTSYANANGQASPAVGATVSGGGGVAATTGPAGTATLTFATAGTFTVRATAANSVRSEPHTVCVHDGNDGNCGTTAPPGTTTPPAPAPAPTPTPPACVHHGNDGLCGTPDRTPPVGHLAIAENTRFPHGHGPRAIAGHVDSDPSGLRDVRMRLTRVVSHGRCEAFSATRRRWATARCGVAYAPFFSIGRAPAFSYLMPARLAKGRYTVDVAATDGAGNADAPSPGRNRIVFRVE